MSQKERENFLRQAILLLDHVRFVLTSLIDFELDLSDLSFEQFINANQHEIYHLCYNTEKCCKCTSGTELPTVKTLDVSQLDILFDKKGKLDGHDAVNSKTKNCCRRAKKNISTKQLDFLLAKTIVSHVCIRVFWYSCTEHVDQTLQQFLDSNKHTIYHLWKCHNVCCKCKSEFIFPSNKPILDESQWDYLFSSETQPCFQHTNKAKFGNKICAVCATDSININNLNKAVQEILIINCCKLRQVVASIDKIIQYTYDMAKDGKMSDRNFQRYAPETEICIQYIAEICGITIPVEEKLKSLKGIIFDEDKCSAYQIALLDAMRKERKAKFVHFFPATYSIPSSHTDIKDDQHDDLQEEVCSDEDCRFCEKETAEYFCQDCDMQFCETCSNSIHKKIKYLVHHHIEIIKNFSCVNTHCSTHNTLLTEICLTHDTPICKFCLAEHELCTTKSIQKAKKGVKQSAKAKEIELKSENLLKNLEFAIGKIKDEIDSIASKTEKFSADIDGCVRKSLDVFTEIKADGVKQIRRHERKMKAAEKQLSTCKKMIEKDNGNFVALMTNASEHNTFLGLSEIEQNLYRIENSLEKLLEDNNVSNIDIKLQFSSEIIKDVVLKSSQTDIKIPLTMGKSQFPVSNLSIDNICLKECVSINIKSATNPVEIRGCTILDNGEMWFVDRKNKRCICYDAKGVLLHEKTLPEEPVAIAFTTESKVAISFSESNRIGFFDANTNMFMERHIKVRSGSIGGLAFHNDKLFVRVGGFGYYIFDANGEEFRRIENRNKYMPYVACTNNRFYFTKWDDAKVFCCDLSGKVIWECPVGHILQPPNGISADAEGNVFVTGTFSNNVVAISADGTNTKEVIMSQKSGLEQPVAIAYDKTENKLLVSCLSGKAVLYSVR